MRKIVALIPLFSQEIANYSHLFCGKPLIYWALSSLEESKDISQIYIACENEEVKILINHFSFRKITFVNPLKDENDWQQSVLNLLNNYNCNLQDAILILPTASPFIQSIHLENLVTDFRMNEYTAMMSGVKINSNAANSFLGEKKQHFIANSVFYLSEMAHILEGKANYSPYEMPAYTLNDYAKDWELAAFVMKKNILSHKIAKRNIRLFATDVDGVLTNAGMYYSESGDELKKFNTRDGMGLVLLRKEGIKTAIITSENTKMVENRAAKLKVDYLYQGKKYGGKLDAILEMCEKEGISLENVAYIGDDINCFDALSNVGFAACPADAEPEILAIPNIHVMTKKGGEGCVREFVRMIL